MAKKAAGNKYVYGICVNKDRDGEGNACPKCESKEVQQVRLGRDFVCEECKEPLMKTLPPKTFWDKYKVAVIGAAAVVAIGGGIAVSSMGGGETSGADGLPIDSIGKDSIGKDPVGGDSIVVDTFKRENLSDIDSVKQQEPVEEPKVKTPKSGGEQVKTATPTTEKASKNRLNLGYGTYEGDVKNGQPHGNGVLTYTRSHRIVETKEDMASPGEYVIGQFRDGKLLMGTWYQSGGNQSIVKR